MKKANPTNKALFGLTLLFMLIAAFSFAAFRETEVLCSGAKKCSQAAPSKSSGGHMLWDDFSRRFVSCLSFR